MTKLHKSQTATEEQMSQVTQTKKFVPKVFLRYPYVECSTKRSVIYFTVIRTGQSQ